MPYRVIFACLMLLAGCDQQLSPDRPVDYDPREAGTVAHALCLLGYTGVPLIDLQTGHHLVEAQLNGQPAQFVVDTGANATVLNAGFVGQFGLNTETSFPGGAIGFGGAGSARQVAIDSLTVGSIPIRQNRIVTADLSRLTNTLARFSDRDIHGIIGQDLLTEHRAVIDVALPVLYLIPEDVEPAPAPADRCSPSGQD